MLVTLERHRYVSQNPVPGRYRLGARLGLIVQTAGPRLDLAAEAQPYMEQLRERTKEVVHRTCPPATKSSLSPGWTGCSPCR